MSVRLAYFDAVTDIEAKYYELREKMTRDDTLAMLAEAHADELYDPDQNAFFWVAIGKAQSKYKEVTGDAAEKAKAGLEYLAESFSLSKYDADALCAKLFSDTYRDIPRAARKRRETKFFDWQIGDVYAYKMRSAEAKAAYLDDCTLLLHVSDIRKFDRHVYPIICELLWLDGTLPKTIDEINKCGFLVVGTYGLDFWDKKPVYTAILKIDSKQDFSELSQNTVYIGNFMGIATPVAPDSEIYSRFIAVHDIERKACYAFHNLGIEYLSDKSQH